MPVQYERERGLMSSTTRKKKIVAIVVLVVVLIATIAAIIVASIPASKAKNKDENESAPKTVLLVSLDGFRPEYLNRGLTPNLLKLAKSGVRAKFLRPVFPTQTFPNHYTIVTGLYPESHGIVANSFFDRQSNNSFSIGSKYKYDSKWWKGEPVWVTAKNHGQKSASFFWVGSENDKKEMRPDYWKHFNSRVPFTERIDQVITWLTMDKTERPNFITLYFEEPDKAGHQYGPDSNQVNTTILTMDRTIGELISKMKSKNVLEHVNIIVVSDHGMARTDPNKILLFNETVDLTKKRFVGRGALSQLYSFDKNFTLKNISKPCSRNIYIMYRDDFTSIPRRLHYTNDRQRIGEIILSPKQGWSILYRIPKRISIKGYHGIDNLYDDMKGIFIASGPDFEQDHEVDHIENIEVYNLLTDLLNIEPALNNGTCGSLHHLLSTTPKRKCYIQPTRPVPIRPFTGITACINCTCSDCDLNKTSVDVLNKHLNLTAAEVSFFQTRHLPYGIPKDLTMISEKFVLTQRFSVTGYNPKLHLPLWTAYKINGEEIQANTTRHHCFRRDVRLFDSESSYCHSYAGSGYLQAPLADMQQNYMAAQDSSVLSNIVPQHKAFSKGPWSQLKSMINAWAIKYKTMHVISGVIFDMDNNGLMDNIHSKKSWLKHDEGTVPIPTHFYKIISKCSMPEINGTCDQGLDTLTFILPHNEESICDESIEYIWFHVATIKDVELLTGTKFFETLSHSRRAQIISKLNAELW